MARLDLQLDRVLTAKQAQQRYGFSEPELRRHFIYRPADIKPLNKSARTIRTAFIGLEDEADLLLWGHAWELAHLAGTAEIRRVLGAAHNEWELDDAGVKGNRPDAVWRPAPSEDQPEPRQIAIEYDAGYPPQVVREKLRGFESFDGVVWGSPSKVRVGHLRSEYAAVGREFVVADLTATVARRIRSPA